MATSAEDVERFFQETIDNRLVLTCMPHKCIFDENTSDIEHLDLGILKQFWIFGSWKSFLSLTRYLVGGLKNPTKYLNILSR